MRTRLFYIVALGALFLSQLLASPEIALAEITEFTPTNHQAAVLVLGQPNFTSIAANTTQVGMAHPYSVRVDPTTGKVFVAERDNHRVLRFASVDALTNGIAAEAVLGQADFNSSTLNRGGPIAANTMSSPFGVFLDTSGRLWVADRANNRVLRFDNAATKGNGADADGVLGQPDFNSNAPITTQGGMNWPYDVYVDTNGRLWVSDFNNNRVLRFDNAAAKADGANANAVLGQSDFASNTTATTQNGMNAPAGLFVDSGGRLWVSEFFNHRVLRFDNAAAKANGANANGVLGQPDFVSNATACTQSSMDTPRGASGDGAGRLYVTDGSNNRVLVFEGASGLANGVDASRVLGQPDFTTCTANTGGLSETSLNTPSRSFYDPAARILWVADFNNNRVLMYGNTAQPATLVLGQIDFTSPIPATTQSGLNHPDGVGVNPASGKVFVADGFNNRVLRFASVSALNNGAEAEAVLGQADFISNLPNRGGGVDINTMDDLLGIFIDTRGNLWVADSDNNRVLRFDNADSKINGAEADGVLGQPDFTSNASAIAQNGMDSPSGVYVDRNGRLWVADHWNDRVLRFDDAANKANGANADGVLGQPDFDSNLGALARNRMSLPENVFVDLEGRLWVSDYGNNRVLRFDNAADKPNGADADGVLGQPNFTTDDIFTCQQDRMFHPRGVSGDFAGRLYVSEDINNRVLIFENAASLSSGANASNLLGQPNFNLCTENTGGRSAASLNSPVYITYDTKANVFWVVDRNNNRVLMYGTPQFRTFLPIVKN